jgi:hypothetical protein
MVDVIGATKTLIVIFKRAAVGDHRGLVDQRPLPAPLVRFRDR